MIDLHALANEMNVNVREVRLQTIRGLYHHETRLIVVSTTLTQAQAYSTLAHELGHAYYEDTPASGVLHDFQERRATTWAAQTVIDPYEYANAEEQYGHHPGSLAQQLGVTRELIEAWQDTYRRAA